MLLKHIKSYFGEVGTIFPEDKDTLQYCVASLHDLTKIIIPHFYNYPLITKKKADFI